MDENTKNSKQFIKWFSGLDKSKKDLVGDKGANLGELYKNKLPVPDGFVITTESYKTFLEKSELKNKIIDLLKNLDKNDFEKIKETSEKIMRLIINAEFPEEIKEEIIESYEGLGTNKTEIEKGSALDILNNASEPIFVAIRTSVPNQKKKKIREQDTYLNIKGTDELLYHVKKCFASLYRKETLFQILKENNLKNLNAAVIVQKMINGDKSGIAYSTDEKKDILLKAIWGLGEGMNLPEVFPDQYVLSRELEILDKKPGTKKTAITRDSSGKLIKVKLKEERAKHEVLTKYESQRIADFSIRLEEIFSEPQEIEFVIENNEIFLVQSRTIEKFPMEIDLKEKFPFKKIPDNSKRIKEIEKINRITKTKLKLILDSPHFAEEAKNTGIKKIGLAKIEKIIFESKKHPNYFLENNYINEYENLIYNGLKEMAKEFDEIYVRTSDIKTNECQNLQNAPKEKEENPFMGLHGIRFGLRYPEILKSELMAIKRVTSSGKKVGILIPQVTSVGEVRKLKEYLKELDFQNPKIGIVIETPAAVQIIKDLVEEISFVLIETDDLIQSLLVLDKKNKNVSAFLDFLHPAMIYQLGYILRVCQRKNVETNVSGELLKNKLILEELIKKGVNSISIEPENAKNLAEEIYRIEKEFLGGTDKEPRQYEIEKAKEELNFKMKKQPKISDKIEEDIEKIEDEKQNYLEEHPEEKIVPVNEEGQEIEGNKKENNLEIDDEIKKDHARNEGEASEKDTVNAEIKTSKEDITLKEAEQKIEENPQDHSENNPEKDEDGIGDEELVTDEDIKKDPPTEVKDTLDIF